ncbi:MAG: leucyl aminopeptidase [Frankiales bacterium]|nr:leucyl aminopeptidase [Frankiales bacterium]
MPAKTASAKPASPRVRATSPTVTVRTSTATLADAAPKGADLAVALSPGEEGPALEPEARTVAAALGLDLDAAVRRDKATGKAGEAIAVPAGERTFHLIGVGDGSARSLRAAGAALARAAKGVSEVATSIVAGRSPSDIRAFSEAIGLASYSYDAKKTEPKPTALRTVVLTGMSKPGDAVERAAVVAEAVRRCRDLVNTPSLEKTPAWLADQAVKLAAASGVDVRIRDEKQLAAEGFGGVVAVGMGSTRPPRLIELTYSPRGAKKHVVLVGKGITYDTGGLSIKPTEGMVTMKTDMAGGAVVIAVLCALRDLGVKVKVTGLVPAAENMPSGSAQRPGDVIRHYDGTTVEVLNTDAEGRLVLADGLSYAVRNLKPDVLVDLATLTGAASLGLGRIHGALFATEDVLAGELLAASQVGGEQTWRMPLVEDYRDTMDSDIADLRNIGTPDHHFQGGAITAALFLREFTGGLPWAHFDIAGPARAEKDDGEITKGASGYGVRILLRWLESR